MPQLFVALNQLQIYEIMLFVRPFKERNFESNKWNNRFQI